MNEEILIFSLICKITLLTEVSSLILGKDLTERQIACMHNKRFHTVIERHTKCKNKMVIRQICAQEMICDERILGYTMASKDSLKFASHK